MCHAHILEELYDLISFESNRLLGIRIDSNRLRQNFSPPCAFIRDLTSGKSSSAKRTSGESEVFDPRADSNRLCFKTIRLSLSVLDMSDIVSVHDESLPRAQWRMGVVCELIKGADEKTRGAVVRTVDKKKV